LLVKLILLPLLLLLHLLVNTILLLLHLLVKFGISTAELIPLMLHLLFKFGERLLFPLRLLCKSLNPMFRRLVTT